MTSSDNRIGTISILIQPAEKQLVSQVNRLLSDHNDLICGRMGIPFKDIQVGAISLIVMGNNDRISALCGKLGKLEGVTVRSLLLNN